MMSLKAYLPKLAALLGTTPAALYERQRALVRAGLVAPAEGRGPGGGIPPTADTIAMLLIAEMSTDSLSLVESRARQIAGLKPTHDAAVVIRMLFQQKLSTFSGALAEILKSAAFARVVPDVTISRNSGNAAIRIDGTPPGYKLGNGRAFDNTLLFSADGSPWPSYRVEARIGPAVLATVAKDLEGMTPP